MDLHFRTRAIEPAEKLATALQEGPGVFSVWIPQVPLPSGWVPCRCTGVLVQSKDSKRTCERGRFPVSAVCVSPAMRGRLVRGVPHLSLSLKRKLG